MSTRRIALFVAVVFVSASSALSMPNYLEDFRRDPFRRNTVDGCQTCHMSAAGGDARNPFGQAFETAGTKITTLLRAQFPDRFNFQTVRGAGGIVFHFSDPASKQLVVENGATRMLVDVEARSVDGNTAAGTPGAGAAAVTSTSSSSQGSDVPVDPFAREGAFFGMNVVNLPNGKPMKKGGVDFTIQHRFSQAIDDAGLGGLFGFDSGATVAFGVRVGLLDRLSVGFMRSNMFKTIEFNSMLNVARQGDSSPVTFAVRGGVEGRQNFHTRYSPFLQPIITRTFADRVSFTASPTFAFHTRNSFSPLPADLQFGEEHKHTVALGLGVGIRALRSTSIVGEYIPRLWGFQGEIKDRPGVSMGLQKSTFRHTFELVVTRQFPMTTSQYAVQGDDYFKIGFNIFRRIR
jgi:hypothetical protein